VVGKIQDDTFQVAAAHAMLPGNRPYWGELYEKPLRDPNIGRGETCLGTDWGRPPYRNSGFRGLFQEATLRDAPAQGLPAHQVDYFWVVLQQLARAANLLRPAAG